MQKPYPVAQAKIGIDDTSIVSLSFTNNDGSIYIEVDDASIIMSNSAKGALSKTQ